MRLPNKIFHVGDLEACVAGLKAGHVGLVVLVNKYDGVDLPNKSCELLIIDGIPTPMDEVERRETLALANSPTRRLREAQRIEQGMGRGVRDRDDHCAVLLLGASLARATRDPDWAPLFSPATRAQLKLSHQIADQIRGEGLDSVRAAVSACLDREDQWVSHARRAVSDIRYSSTGRIRSEAVAARQAFDFAAIGQYAAAAERLQAVINEVDDPLLRTRMDRTVRGRPRRR